MQRDIITHFTRFASLRYKVLHESYIVQNSISWRNINFEKSYTVDKSLPPNEKIGRLSKRGSLMRLKKHFRTLKLDYDIFFYVKNFNDTTSTIYKDEKKLLREFKKYIFRKGKKRKIVVAETVSLINKRMKHIEDRMNSPEYHPLSPSA
ncbi:hypothetical protein C2G38_2216627 [Gigaspora rosea]|uniref:Uncharacterized protein n=1 Tax=Gigaspora rosea TaxID=44941 RepID=A0A397UCY1_9GLOM|nr:hypothetical protein C2G38_2216627 [Gigaspora rosea]